MRDISRAVSHRPSVPHLSLRPHENTNSLRIDVRIIDFSTPAHETPGRPATVEDSTATLPLNGTQSELQRILKELQFITKRMKRGEIDSEIISDWKFAAMVVDRFVYIFKKE
ncbi:hypothetical protein PV328_010683 [Microctonus aethiopoides]|uniref:Neurotransmitter-gated ion-channel transmembrane domain-containing protein n=1 Tax=Microctonus aethiopoides TaxID=144406 RepID=A0AA39KQF0_9HYME|nr:hypothetical protein PV328_010683 [Microctonus aethiopoides]